MHSYIISGNSEEARRIEIQKHIASWNIAEFDVVAIPKQETSIGIEDIREFIQTLHLAPRQSDRLVGLIEWGEQLTIPAQQALLKTLEEPPGSAYIIIGTSNSEHLLPTIISRAQVIQLTQNTGYDTQTIDAVWQIISDTVSATPGKKLANLTAVCKTNKDAALFLDQALIALAQYIKKQRDNAIPVWVIPLTHALLDARKYDGTNVQMQSVLESIFLSVKS